MWKRRRAFDDPPIAHEPRSIEYVRVTFAGSDMVPWVERTSDPETGRRYARTFNIRSTKWVCSGTLSRDVWQKQIEHGTTEKSETFLRFDCANVPFRRVPMSYFSWWKCLVEYEPSIAPKP